MGVEGFQLQLRSVALAAFVESGVCRTTAVLGVLCVGPGGGNGARVAVEKTPKKEGNHVRFVPLPPQAASKNFGAISCRILEIGLAGVPVS